MPSIAHARCPADPGSSSSSITHLERSSFLKRRGVYRTQSLEARAAAIEELVSRGTLDQSASLTPSDMTSRMRDATSETAIETALAALKQTMLTAWRAEARLVSADGRAQAEGHKNAGRAVEESTILDRCRAEIEIANADDRRSETPPTTY